ncbi:MAG: ribonuclease T [Proteobacteria bacterium]|nr:ribonuclease T [Pseudomonadota bacterium]
MELSERFRGYLPVVLDLETGGFDHQANPILELACSFLQMQDDRLLIKGQESWNVEPVEGLVIEPASLKVTGIDLEDPSRDAMDEETVLREFFSLVRSEMKLHGCHRAILVAHNASFDRGFLNTACNRWAIKRNPFHPFTTLDTATLGALAYGHTVLREACRRADIEFSEARAHGAAYDADRTAELFCHIVNTWDFQTAWLDSASGGDY